MSKQVVTERPMTPAQHHTKAAEHHEKAALHHKETAKHYEAGNHEKPQSMRRWHIHPVRKGVSMLLKQQNCTPQSTASNSAHAGTGV